MKLKKVSIYLLSLLALGIMFSLCYYFSYVHALDQFNKSAIERNEQLYTLLEQSRITPTEAPPLEDAVEVGVSQELMIKPSTKYILEIYDMKTDTLSREELNPPGHMVGLTRQELEQYLVEYMKDMTLSEYNKGLIAYELLSFSDQEVVIKKTYNEDFVPYRFYVVVKDGYVVVYNSDLKSVYSYTHIEAKYLPEEERIRLSQGIYVNSLDELYALLESYSS